MAQCQAHGLSSDEGTNLEIWAMLCFVESIRQYNCPGHKKFSI